MPKIPIAASCPRRAGWCAIARRSGWTDDGEENGRRGVDGVRVDDGVYEGGEVSMFYDPMIAKLITWGKTRDEAADKQIAALDVRDRGAGPQHRFRLAIMQHPRFRSGELTTGFIAEEYPDGFTGAPRRAKTSRSAACGHRRLRRHRTRGPRAAGSMASWPGA
jgi:propionyl-CoA carboxylase alpha chain